MIWLAFADVELRGEMRKCFEVLELNVFPFLSRELILRFQYSEQSGKNCDSGHSTENVCGGADSAYLQKQRLYCT